MNAAADGTTMPTWWYSQPWMPATVIDVGALVPAPACCGVNAAPGEYETLIVGTGPPLGEPACRRMTADPSLGWSAFQAGGCLSATPLSPRRTGVQSLLTNSTGGAIPAPPVATGVAPLPPSRVRPAMAPTTATPRAPTPANGSQPRSCDRRTQGAPTPADGLSGRAGPAPVTTRNVVVPTANCWPAASPMWSTRVPSTTTPLRLADASTTGRPSTSETTAWARETVGSARTTSSPGSRPIRSGRPSGRRSVLPSCSQVSSQWVAGRAGRGALAPPAASLPRLDSRSTASQPPFASDPARRSNAPGRSRV